MKNRNGVGLASSSQGEVVTKRQVERRVHVVVGVAARGNAVAGIQNAFGHTELRLVGDVTNGTGLSTAAEQRALRTLEDFDALHVDQVDVIVAGRELHRLVIEVQRHVRERSRRRLRLVTRAGAAESAQEDVARAGAIAAEGHVRRVFQQIVE